MIRLLTRSAGVLALVFVTTMHPTGPVLAAEEPDLQVEIVGLAPNSQQDVQIRVTNVSTWWANETTARVETVSPAPANIAPQIFVENLDPGQSTMLRYTLAGSCNAHVVKVNLVPAKNYAGVPESNLGNNAAQKAVCQAGAPTGAESVPRQPGFTEVVPREGVDTRPPGTTAANVTLPEHLRPGRHAAGGPYPPLVLNPGPTSLRLAWTREFGADLIGFPSVLSVGWAQFETSADWWGIISGSTTWIAQTAVNFDLSQLDEVPNPSVEKALLTFDEHESRWTDGDGNPRKVKSCVHILGIATADWVNEELDDLIPNRMLMDAQFGSNEWVVTDHVRDQMRDRGNQGLRHGYVLRGGLDEVKGDDLDSCVSHVSNLKLTITYIVPS